MATWRYEREIQVEAGYDVVVAGGGPSGVAAAVAAARSGAKVLLLESTGALGGMGSNGLVSVWYSLSDGVRVLTKGLFWEIVLAMRSAGGLRAEVDLENFPTRLAAGFGFSAEVLKRVLDQLVLDSGADLLLCTRVIDADVDRTSGRIRGVVVQHIEGLRYVPAKAFIDCTGDAVLSDLCGVPYREAGRDTPNIMPPTLCGLTSNIDWSRFDHKVQQEMVERKVDEGYFSQPDRHVPGQFRSQQSYGIQNAGHLFKTNAVKVQSLTSGYIKGRRLAAEYAEFYRRFVPGCEKIELVNTGALLGARESRSIEGEYQINYDDFRARRHFDDQIGVYNKAVDIHVYDLTPEEYKRYHEQYTKRDVLKVGESYGLPYGILVPRGSMNLWAAGRCVSADVQVHGAIRDQPAAYMMGEAAGCAAVQSIRTGQPACDLNVADLVQTLRDRGAYLPQAKPAVRMTRR